MLQNILGVGVIVLVYVCLFIVLFAPTIYAVWIYVVGRRVRLRSKGLLRVAVTTFCVNSVLVYFAVHLATDYFVTTNVAEKDALAAKTLRAALDSQRKFFEAHGRYYSVGPIRGPYQDDHGLTVEKDVIVMVEPRWDKDRGSETFDAYALHVWGRGLLTGTADGSVVNAAAESEHSSRVRSRLVNSVR